jgi:uncharacterized membrane protein
MLNKLIASAPYADTILAFIEAAALAIEVLAVAIIGLAILYSTFRYLFKALRSADRDPLYRELKSSLGASLLLGLEILVAADIVRTVALEATLQSVAVLGLLVLIRTFLSWALVVELEGRWPWQPARQAPDSNET